ncbi:hypothetical protein BG015_007512 [Linnemannia schmuckeri]|uniref:Uncharacterized protein n=1 Tax=Linnemannia schmuckeri TaxID=64567 RepID=A0A9P5RYC1_9FUNG|nr:hypothetical protein BG015_007512 [Linnemannia schmuckeri]
MSNADNVIVLSAPTNVQMNSIKLTEEAVPVTMTITGYILDKAADGSTVVYSITPVTSTSLQRVDVKGGSPSFSKSYAATALNKQIITYSPSVSGNSTFNSFETATQTWSGAGLMNNGGGGENGGGSLIISETSGTSIGQQELKLVATTENPESDRCENSKKANNGGASGFDEAPSESSSTPYGSPYISPNQNRVSTVSANASIATPTVTAVAVTAVATASSPEYIYAKSRASSYGGTNALLSPQLYPEDKESNVRTSHTFAS